MQLTFFEPTEIPAFDNQAQYLLLVSCSDGVDNYGDELLWGMWYLDGWWILNDELQIPFDDDTFEQDGELNEVVSFIKLANHPFYTLKGWTPIWGGCGIIKRKEVTPCT